jgi:hypothetical protein
MEWLFMETFEARPRITQIFPGMNLEKTDIPWDTMASFFEIFIPCIAKALRQPKDDKINPSHKKIIEPRSNGILKDILLIST